MNVARRKAAERLMRRPWSAFEAIDRATAKAWPPWMTRAWANNHFVVMVRDGTQTSHGPAIRAMVQRHDGEPIREWPVMQRIKNELFGEEAWAVEYFPPASQLVDNANVYWMWIYPPGVLPIPLHNPSEE